MARLNNDDRNLIIVGMVGVGAWFLIRNISSVFPDFGREDEVEAEEVAKEALTHYGSPWNPNFYKQAPGQKLLLTNAFADELCEDILESFSPFWDSFPKVLGVFKRLKTQSQVSYLVERFSLYTRGHDLLTFLMGSTWPKDRLSAEETNQIIAYVKKLPKWMPA